VLEYLTSWSGKNSDLYSTVVKAFSICDERGYETFDYDADGLGSGVRGDARVLNEARQGDGRKEIRDMPFQGSGSVSDPENEMVAMRKNKDFFANMKAMSWWSLRLKFQATYRAVVQGLEYEADDLISIDPNLEGLLPLAMELSQPTYSLNSVGKVLVDKSPHGMRSPNLADAVMICFNPQHRSLEVWLRL
jgi:hypothetical protein